MGYRNQFVDGIKSGDAGRWDFEHPIHKRGEKWKCGVCGKGCDGKEALRRHRWEHAY